MKTQAYRKKWKTEKFESKVENKFTLKVATK